MSDFKAVYIVNQQAIVTGGLNPRGAYDAGTAYVKGDSVSYLSSSYVAVGSTTGNLPTNTTFWQLLAAEGTNGTNGQGVPTGGTANQVLAKIDGTNYNTDWVTPISKGFIIAMSVAL